MVMLLYRECIDVCLNRERSTCMFCSIEIGEHRYILDKVIYLLHLLDSLNTHPHLKNAWVLKGGTALNVFIFDIPRLSVDIDLDYIGNLNREKRLKERQPIEQACAAVFEREGYAIKRKPREYAGGKWILSYQSFTGGPGHIEVDFNYMYREPLWEITKLDSVKIGSVQARNIPILNQHELLQVNLLHYSPVPKPEMYMILTYFQEPFFGFAESQACIHRVWRDEPPRLEKSFN